MRAKEGILGNIRSVRGHAKGALPCMHVLAFASNHYNHLEQLVVLRKPTATVTLAQAEHHKHLPQVICHLKLVNLQRYPPHKPQVGELPEPPLLQLEGQTHQRAIWPPLQIHLPHTEAVKAPSCDVTEVQKYNY